MRRIAAILAIALLSGCAPVGSPSTNPDHGPPQPPNGNNINPDRPGNIPRDFQYVSWHVLALNEDWEDNNLHVPVRIHIDAVSDAPVQGNVHGPYPLDLYVYTPYTHTMWYQPGVTLTTTIAAVADPPLQLDHSPVTIVCVASSSHHVNEDFREDETVQAQDYCRAHWASDIEGSN